MYKLKPFSIYEYQIQSNLKRFQSVFVSLPFAPSLGLPAEKIIENERKNKWKKEQTNERKK